MKYCERCKVDVAGDRQICPLCQRPLIGQSASIDLPAAFPEIPPIGRKHGLFFRILMMSGVTVAVVSVAVNYLLRASGWWAQYVVLGLVCAWISIYLAVSRRKNLPKNMMTQATVITLFSILWDVCTGWRAWSITYVMPILFTALIVAMGVIVAVTSVRIEQCMIYFCLAGLFGILPILFLWVDILSQAIPSLICVAASILMLTLLCIFWGDRMIAELRRRLHL